MMRKLHDDQNDILEGDIARDCIRLILLQGCADWTVWLLIQREESSAIHALRLDLWITFVVRYKENT